jgi:hypothetical protein
MKELVRYLLENSALDDPPLFGSIEGVVGGPETLLDLDIFIGGSDICWLVTDTRDSEATMQLPDLPNLDLTISIGMMSDYIGP